MVTKEKVIELWYSAPKKLRLQLENLSAAVCTIQSGTQDGDIETQVGHCKHTATLKEEHAKGTPSMQEITPRARSSSF
jgi:hypothetical protein